MVTQKWDNTIYAINLTKAKGEEQNVRACQGDGEEAPF